MSAGTEQETWTPVASSFGQYDFDSSTLSHNCDDIFNFNPLADYPTLPDFGTSIGNDLISTGINCPEQLSVDPYFDFNAFDIDSAGDLSYQTSEQTSGMQSQFSASLDDGRRQGFATETC